MVLLPTSIKGQTVLLPGSGMQVLPGTTVRVAGNTTWQLPAGSQLINDGTIVVGASGSLSEAEGAAILGSGVERTTRTYGAPLTGEDPAGLFEPETLGAHGTGGRGDGDLRALRVGRAG